MSPAASSLTVIHLCESGKLMLGSRLSRQHERDRPRSVFKVFEARSTDPSPSQVLRHRNNRYRDIHSIQVADESRNTRHCDQRMTLRPLLFAFDWVVALHWGSVVNAQPTDNGSSPQNLWHKGYASLHAQDGFNDFARDRTVVDGLINVREIVIFDEAIIYTY